MYPFSIEGINFICGEEKIDIANSVKHGDKVVQTTGIKTVFQTKKNAEDLAYECTKELLNVNNFSPNCLIYVSQSQKFILPGSSVLLHKMLGLKSDCLVFDINAGCSGFTQALLLANNLIKKFNKILIICSDTYRKKLEKNDRSTLSVFSDGASAILISDKPKIKIEKVITKIDGSKHNMLIQKLSGEDNFLHMSGRDLWNFTRLEVVPDIIKALNFYKKKKFRCKRYIYTSSK